MRRAATNLGRVRMPSRCSRQRAKKVNLRPGTFLALLRHAIAAPLFSGAAEQPPLTISEDHQRLRVGRLRFRQRMIETISQTQSHIAAAVLGDGTLAQLGM